MRIVCVITLLLSLPLTAAAQTTATLAGRVVDGSGAVLPGVSLVVRQVDTGLTRAVTTDADGRYTVATLPVGAYEIRATLDGFRPLVREGVTLTVTEIAVVNLTLEVGGVNEVVMVSAGAGVVNTRSGELSYLVAGRAIEELPLNGRNYTDLALLQPSVVAYPHRDGGSVVAHGLGMSVNGQDPRSNVYLLDGTLLNDMTNGPAGSAAGTALGMETVQEFRVETNAYGAEFGRNSGAQINVLTRSGTNQVRGSAYEFHRNDRMDAKNYFDVEKPPFTRNQFGGAFGGPVRRDRLFYFVGVEALRENLGRTITSTVPDDNARLGLLPDPARPGQFLNVGIHPGVAPYLAEYPRANGAALGDGTALYRFQFDQVLDQDFLQGRLDYHASPGTQLFARYTFDDAAQRLPTDYPQFPRSFVSRNQFATLELRRVWSPRLLGTFRAGLSRTRVGQDVEVATTTPLAPFVPGRSYVGNIDVGGLNRFGTQSSVDVRFLQHVFSLQQDSTYARGRHVVKFGGLAERYLQDMVNPTFSLGTYSFANLRALLENRATSFIGLRPDGQFDRYWRFWLMGAYVQHEYQASSRLSLNAGLRYEFTTMPSDINGRDSALVNLTDRAPSTGRLFDSPGYTNLSPRLGFAWNVDGAGRTAVRGGYGLYYNTNSYQNLIVTVTNPPATPRVVFPAPTFPNPPFERASGNSIRPVQWDYKTPRVHVWNVNVQQELPGQIAATIGYAGSRGRHLLRSNDVNTAIPVTGADGRPFFPAGGPRQNTAWTTIELKSADGDSWYRAFIVELRRRFTDGLMFQSSYTWSKSEDTTQASTFFSDATNGTTSAFPEFIAGYNKGLSDFHAEHNWVVSVSWDVPFARALTGAAGAVLDGWRLSGIMNMRTGSPLTVFVQNNRSRSLWQPSLGPGIGRDRASYAPGFGPGNAVTGNPDQWFNPAAFVTPAAGTFGDTGRGDFIGPDLRTVDLSLVKDVRLPAFGPGGRAELRVEMFNVFNRANFGIPALTAFAGVADNEAPLASFGRIRNTITSARQVQLGVRVRF
ncbi:MAG: TonB-dependent receptor [Vicinamibacterales bacterium]|nr:TonB-dependent receptor [Vicinamibacterales bacterium]